MPTATLTMTYESLKSLKTLVDRCEGTEAEVFTQALRLYDQTIQAFTEDAKSIRIDNEDGTLKVTVISESSQTLDEAAATVLRTHNAQAAVIAYHNGNEAGATLLTERPSALVMLDTAITLEGVRDHLLELIQESGITPDEIAKKMDDRSRHLKKVNASTTAETTLH